MPSSNAHATNLSPEETGLLDWFGSFTPGQRLAQLQSRVDFLRAFRPDDNAQLPASAPDAEPSRG